MFYTNSKCLNCCDNSDFECHSENIVAEEMECTTIIEEHEKNFQPTQQYINENINKTLFSRLTSTSLIALSMLEGAGATDDLSQNCKSTVLPNLCYMAGDICRIIKIKDELKNKINSSISEIIKEAFDYSLIEIRKDPLRRTNEHGFNISIPLTITSNTNINCDTIGRISFFANKFLYNYVNDIDLSDEHRDSLCLSDSTAFCTRLIEPRVSIFSGCCPSIESHITYPGLSIEKKIPTVSDTVVNAITESTTAIASEIISQAATESTTLASIFTPSSIEPQIISRSVSSYLCGMGKSLCRLINILGSGDNSDETIQKTLKGAFDYSENSLGRNPLFNFSIPLILPHTTGDSGAEEPLISRLWYMGQYLRRASNNALLRRHSNTEYYSFCGDGDNNVDFCDKNYNVNTSFSDICCSSIGSYITYPYVLTETVSPQIVVSTTTESEILTSTTVASKIINSTDIGSEVLNLTTMASEVIGSTVIGSEFTNLTTAESELTTLIPTKITLDTASINALNIVLIICSSIALAILAFLGYRALKSSKSYQSQPVSQSDNIDTAEREDLV
ncbi:hypothetical protein [Candidatus Ichthyocystis hellenicum]|nr:hypothetical protein [Candidatus Ichthyocystis hellenicum]